MLRGRRTFLFLVLSIVLGPWSVAWAIINFTGRADVDFPSEACIADPGGNDVGMPHAFPSSQISGFDIRSLCFSYDPTNDTLYVGIQTFPDPSGRPIIFGDADGDGDPGAAGLTLQGLGGQDFPDLSGQEFFTLTIDFDRDTAPDLVVGTNTGNSLNQFQAVGGVAPPDNNLLLAAFPRFYGAPLAGVTTNIPFFPSSAKPHLEFLVIGLSKVPGFSSLNFADPDSYFQLYVTTGSYADDGISEEYFPNIATYLKMKVDALRDTDGDGIPDAFDLDNDNDGIPDLVEKNLSQYDTNKDGVLSAAEIAASGLDKDGDGDIDIKDVGAWPDTDGDGIPDYLDTDSDNDGIPDALEAGNPPGTLDSDGDGIPDFREVDSDGDGIPDNVEDANRNGKVDPGETDPRKADTDGDGLCDGSLVVGSCTGAEKLKGTDPLLVDTDGDGLCDGSIIVPPCVQSEGNLKTDPLTPDNPNTIKVSIESIMPAPQPQPAANASESPLGGDVDLSGGPVGLQGAGVGCQVVSGGSSMMTFWWLFLVFFLGVVPKVWGLNSDHYRPSSDGLGFLGAESAHTLPKKEFSLGLSQHISHNPLEFGRNANGQFLDNVVSYFYVWNLWGSFGLLEDLDVGINIPMSLATQIEDLTSTIERNSSSLGDIRLQGKWHFLNPNQNFLGADLAVLAFLNLPSGSSADFFGEGAVTGGMQAIAGRSFGHHEVDLSLGFYARGKETISASNLQLLTVGTEMSWGAGWRWPFSLAQQWYVMSHLWGKTDFDSKATSPAEWDFGFQKRFRKYPLEATLGTGFGLGRGYGSPDYRLVLGLSYFSR